MLHRCNRKQGNVKGQFVYYWAIIERNLVILGIMPKKPGATTSHKGETVFLFFFFYLFQSSTLDFLQQFLGVI